MRVQKLVRRRRGDGKNRRVSSAFQTRYFIPPPRTQEYATTRLGRIIMLLSCVHNIIKTSETRNTSFNNAIHDNCNPISSTQYIDTKISFRQ